MHRRDDDESQGNVKKKQKNQENQVDRVDNDVMHHALTVKNVLTLLCQHLFLSDIVPFSQCSSFIHEAAKEYFHSYFGMRSRFWDHVAEVFPPAIVTALVTFQEQTGALFTGSTVLKVFTGDSWKAKDLDILVTLTPESAKAFGNLLQEIQDTKVNLFINLSDSLHMPCFQHPDRPATPPPPVGTTISRPSGRATLARRDPRFKTWISWLKPVSRIVDSCGDHYMSGYNKHVRSVYYSLKFSNLAIDVVFVIDCDAKAAGGLINWMKYNFDFQICANAILTKTAYCYAPHEIAKRMAFMRMDQYCIDNQYCGHRKWAVAERYVCDCYKIVERRKDKYMERNFTIMGGTYQEYLRFRNQN